MSKLLRANMKRLWRDKGLWLTCLVCMAVSMLSSVDAYYSVQAMTERDSMYQAEYFFYNMVPMLGLFLGVFASLFFGTEYSDGTIRNKLIVGRARKSIYLASFVPCLTAGILIIFFWLAGAFLFLILSKLPFAYGVDGVLVSLILIAGMMLVFTSIYTLVGNLSTNKAMTVLLNFAAFFGLMMFASGIYASLCEPEFVGGMTMINGELVDMGQLPNPSYLSGSARDLWQRIFELNPMGQGILIANVEVVNPVRQLVYSLVISVVLLFTGMFLFEKTDLK